MKRLTSFQQSAVLVACSLVSISVVANQVEHPMGEVARFNILGQVTGVISPDPDGDGPLHRAATRNTYNERGLLEKVEYGYLDRWQSESITPENWSGFEVSYFIEHTYDSNGWKTSDYVQSATTFDKSFKQYSYDANGRVDCVAVRMNPDVYDLLPHSTDACTLSTEGDYGPDRIIKYDYNLHDQIILETRAYGTPLQQVYSESVYNSSGLRTDHYDANGNRSHYTYDGFGRLEKWYFPDDSIIEENTNSIGSYNSMDYEQYTYDANDNIKTLRKRDERLITYHYSPLNRVVKKDLPGTLTLDVYYDYDLRGLPQYARFGSHGGSGVTYEYDGFGRLATETQSNSGTSFSVRSEYDNNGNRDKIYYPDNQVFSFHYNNTNQLEEIRQQQVLALIDYEYDNLRRLEGISRANGTYSTIGYDGMARMNHLAEDIGLSLYSSEANLSYTPASQIEWIDESNSIYHYNGPVKSTLDYTSNGLNQYAIVGGVSFGYDDNGNLTSDDVNSYDYDVENRLTKITGTANVEFFYDPTGRLYKQTIDGVTKYFVYDGDSLIAEYNASKSMSYRYIHGRSKDTPMLEYQGSSLTNANRRYLHRNHQGSIIAFSDHDGSVEEINSYDEFGVPGQGNSGRFGFTGQMFIPEVGLYYYKARIYHPKLGRFLQTDPVGYKDQMNLYTYVGNDPLKYTDPTGKIKVLSTALKEISEKYGWGECKQCATEMSDAISQAGETGKRLDARAPGAQNIWSDRNGGNVSTNGDHAAVEVDGMVYDNMNGDGVPRAEWEADLHTPSGELEVKETPIGSKTGGGSSTMASVMATVITVVEVVETVVDPIGAVFYIPEVGCATITPCD